MDKDNVVKAKFREPTNLETYLEYIQESPPDTIFSLAIIDGNLAYIHYGLDDFDSMVGKLEKAKVYLQDLEYELNGEE